jgi:hypothetical protein
MKSQATTPAFLATSLILLLILFIRSTRGLDLTDEMQYYGQIKGLLESGILFSNDLFIQQSVYILLYPAFYIYHSAFGFEGLVFFGRLLMSLITIYIYLYAYQKFIKLEFSKTIASLTALTIVFAVPYHGIFAPSYNTISQVLWTVFTIKFFEWKRCSAVSWGTLPIIMFFAHPTSAVVMSFVILVRLLVEREFIQIGRLFLVFSAGTLVSIPIILNFAEPDEYLTSITFSSGYGVGTSFFSNKTQPIALILIYAMFLYSFLFQRLLSRLRLSILAILGLIVAIIVFLVGFVQWGYSPRVVYVLSSLSALAYSLALSNISAGDRRLRQSIHWLVLLLLLFATTLSVTSGNGIGQATGAFMVGLPLLLGIAVMHVPSKGTAGGISLLGKSSVILLFALFVVQWSRYPYREHVWWRTNYSIHSVPEFRFINTSLERSELVGRMRQVFGTAAKKKSLIVGDLPALYFILDTIPETCMLYMHSVTSQKSEKALLDCFRGKSPEIVVDISTEDSRISNLMKLYYSYRGFDCAAGSIQLEPRHNYIHEPLKYFLCTLPA